MLRGDIITLADITPMTLNGQEVSLTGRKLPFMKIGNEQIGFWEYSDKAIAYVLIQKKSAFTK